jgi:uncharacterized membrane protein
VSTTKKTESDQPDDSPPTTEDVSRAKEGGTAEAGGAAALVPRQKPAEGVVLDAGDESPQQRPALRLVTQTTKIEQRSFSGPLPSPDVLKGYGEIVPTAPERIVAMAEKQSSHRREAEMTALKGSISNERLAMLCGTIVILAMLGAAGWMVSKGVKDVAAILSAVPVVGIFAVLLRRRLNNKEAKALEQKQGDGRGNAPVAGGKERPALPPKSPSKGKRKRARKKRP